MPFALYAYATSVLSRRAGRAGGHEGVMTRDEAARLVGSLIEDGASREGARLFAGGDVAGVMIGAAEVFFEYSAAGGTLKCSALVYRFRKEPRPGVLDGFFAEEASGAAAAGGGALEYRAETRSLFLSRTYLEAAPPGEFAEDVKRLASASLAWGTEVLERVAARTR